MDFVDRQQTGSRYDPDDGSVKAIECYLSRVRVPERWCHVTAHFMTEPNQSSRSLGPDEVRDYINAHLGLPPLRSYESLVAAREDPDAALVLSGDWGGIVYLTSPFRLVKCTFEVISVLASDLDATAFMGPASSIETAIENHPVGTGIAAGSGGAPIPDRIWIHPKITDEALRDQAAAVLDGTRSRLDQSVLHRVRDAGLIDLHARRLARAAARPPRDQLAWDFDIYEPHVPFDD